MEPELELSDKIQQLTDSILTTTMTKPRNLWGYETEITLFDIVYTTSSLVEINTLSLCLKKAQLDYSKRAFEINEKARAAIRKAISEWRTCPKGTLGGKEEPVVLGGCVGGVEILGTCFSCVNPLSADCNLCLTALRDKYEIIEEERQLELEESLGQLRKEQQDCREKFPVDKPEPRERQEIPLERKYPIARV